MLIFVLGFGIKNWLKTVLKTVGLLGAKRKTSDKRFKSDSLFFFTQNNFRFE